MSLSPENAALIGRLFGDDRRALFPAPDDLNTLLNAARAEGPAQPPLPDAGEWVWAPADPGTCEGDDSGWVLAFLHALHAHLPEDERPTSWMQFSDAQRARIQAAYRAMIAAAPQQEGQLARNPGQLEASTQQEGGAVAPNAGLIAEVYEYCGAPHALTGRLMGPHEWGYRCLTEGSFISDDMPFIAAEVITRLEDRLSAVVAALEPFAKLYGQILRDHGPDWFVDEGQVMRAALAYPVADSAVVWRHFRLAAEAFSAPPQGGDHG